MKTYILIRYALPALLSCSEAKEIRIEPAVITIKRTELVQREGAEDRIAVYARSSSVQNFYIEVPKSEESNYHVGVSRGYMVVSKSLKFYNSEVQADLSYVHVLGWEQQGKMWAVNFQGVNGIFYFYDTTLGDSTAYFPGAVIPFLAPR